MSTPDKDPNSPERVKARTFAAAQDLFDALGYLVDTIDLPANNIDRQEAVRLARRVLAKIEGVRSHQRCNGIVLTKHSVE